MQLLAKILIRKMEKQIQNQFETSNPVRKEGEITIQKPTKKTPHSQTDTFGDYVEFEEIK